VSRQGDDISPTIFDILSALDKALRFQLVEDRDHGGSVNAKLLRDVLLRERDAIVDHQENSALSTGDAKRLQRPRGQLVQSLVSVFYKVSEPVTERRRGCSARRILFEWHANIVLAYRSSVSMMINHADDWRAGCLELVSE
jgi:hypothetical protein